MEAAAMGWREILAGASATDARNDVRYLEVPARRVLNPVRGATPLPFELTANPYLNCEVGCAYCYAREFSDRRAGGPARFDREVYAKVGAVEALRAEVARLARAGMAGKTIALGTATDPYQPLERRRGLTRALLEVLATVEGVRLSITTKSDLVLRDVDVLQAIGRRGFVQVNVTVTTVDRDLARRLEPRAPTPGKRLRAVTGLVRAGVPAGVFLMPVLPGLTDAPRDVRAVVWAAREAGARYLAARTLFLRGAAREAFFAWLGRERPELVARYRRWYRGGAYAAEDVEDRIRRLVEALRRQVGLPAGLAPPPAVATGPRQLSLFEALPGPEASAPRTAAGPRRLPCVADPAAAARGEGAAGVA